MEMWEMDFGFWILVLVLGARESGLGCCYI